MFGWWRLRAELAMQAAFEVGAVLMAQGKPDEAIAAWTDYLAKYPNAGGSAPARRAILEARWRIRLQEVTELSVAYHTAAADTPVHIHRPA